MIDKARKIALECLYKIEIENGYSNIILNDEIKNHKNNLNPKDIGLISEIVYGVTTWKLTLDEIVKKYSKIRLKKISPWILNILRIGAYQIIFLDKIPKSAAVNESVNLAKRYGHKASSNFVNAILRKIEKQDYLDLLKIEDDTSRISKSYSMPIWIIEKLLQEKNIEEVEEISRCSNIRPNINIRVNKLKTNKEEIEKTLKDNNIEFNESILTNFISIKKMKNIENIEEFNNGLFTIQETVSGMPSILLEPRENENILDACSAPGGKTTYIAELMNNKGKIEAWDIHEHRTKLVEQNAKRLGIKIIETKIKDATKFDKEYIEKFDKILLDVPCLGTGVIKRKPDIKWKKNIQDIKEINEIQKEILNTCSKYLKKGGLLIYSTCSVLKEENDGIIDNFLQNCQEFSIQKIELKNEKFFKKYITKKGELKVYQNEQTDGFYICKLIKN